MIELNATFFAQILNFLILVGILRLVAYKPIVRILQERSNKIQESLDKADSDAREADKLLAEYKAKIQEANVQAAAIRSEAEKRASEYVEAEKANVKRQIEDMKKAAEAEIERDRERAVEQLKGQMVALSLAAAGKIISKNISETDNEQIISEFVNQLDKDKIGELPC